MSYDVVIEIMGGIADAETLLNVVEALEVDACEWPWGHGADAADIIDQVRKAVEEKGMLTLVKSDTGGLFAEARSACQEAGLSYIVSYGQTGEEGYSEAIFYRDGGEEFQIPLDVGNEMIPLRDVREAVRHGAAAVQAVIDEYDRKVLKDVPREFFVAPAILAELSDSGNSP